MKSLFRFADFFEPERSGKSWSIVASSLMATLPLMAADPFAEGVRPTDPVMAEEQAKTFQLPPGFAAQLVATEPDINKPMNMAFDAKGRLWVTTSIEYPWAAPTNRVGRDRLMIFENFGQDGRARKVTQFAGELNIPIGIYPIVGNANFKHDAAIVWSIPHIWLIEDTDGDGKSDKRTPLYGPFDYSRDTHGNQASFRRGFDGWLYATHGFNNDSRVTAPDGSSVHLNSGNTYRILLDGSRIEHHTHGQVNPYGLAWDPMGNLYSSDCHSAPTYQLLAGGYYPSFGKPHDGLGFAPVLMEHSHGSTAIDGMVFYSDHLWPDEFQNNIFVGNVMTSRLNRDRLEFHGSSPKAIELDDFVKTTDPWFRPVDNLLGPDGALYIADFYNRIIGHYEVPLVHPGRDRERGRIWRIVHTGKDGKPKLHQRKMDLTKANANDLIKELADPSLAWRTLAANQLADRIGAPAVEPLRKKASTLLKASSEVKNGNHDERSVQLAHVLWLLNRFGALEESTLAAGARDKSNLVRVHTMRILAERAMLARRNNDHGLTVQTVKRELEQFALPALNDADALVQRCAAEALGNGPDVSFVQQLVSLRNQVPKEDTHLLYVVRKSIRNHLNEDAIFQQVVEKKDWSEADLYTLADVAVAVKSERAGSFLNRTVTKLNFDKATLTALLQHISRYAPVTELDGLGKFVRTKYADDLGFQMALFNGVLAGAEQRGLAVGGGIKDWGDAICTQVLSTQSESEWRNFPFETAPTASPWGFETRVCADGEKAVLLSSLPLGEQLTGTLQSPPFALPEKLTFYLAGHNGIPGNPSHDRNRIRLRALIDGTVLAEAMPARNDQAQKVIWDLAAYKGKKGFIEIIDGDTGSGYAWIAVGRFEPSVISLPKSSPGEFAKRQQTAAELVAKLQLQSQRAACERLVADDKAEGEVRVAAAKALLAISPTSTIPMLSKLLNDFDQPGFLRNRVGEFLAEQRSPEAQELVIAAMKQVSSGAQTRWATALASTPTGAERLLTAAEQGTIPARLLQTPNVKTRLQAVKPQNWEKRLEQVTKNLPPADEAREKLIAERRNRFNSAVSKVAEGHRVFLQNCSSCHKIGSEGGIIGPQLDGIGNRGLERMVEDILDPNRNVDVAFRSTLIETKDDELVSGIFRREEGETLILADATGKEFSVPKKEVKSRRESDQSLMPDNFGEAMSVEDFNHLLAYLLAQNASQSKTAGGSH